MCGRNELLLLVLVLFNYFTILLSPWLDEYLIENQLVYLLLHALHFLPAALVSLVIHQRWERQVSL